MREVVFVDGMRTPFGKQGGTLKDICGSDLAAMTVKALVAKTGVLEKGGKAIGIEKVLAHYRISRNETIAFGDGENDVDMLKLVHTRSTCGDLYIALVVAMLAGRVFSGIAKALIFMPGISMTAWITASFVTALPGILIQLVFLPGVVMTLMKAKIIPVRYTKKHSAA